MTEALRPTTGWQTKVLEIEEPFAPLYDEEEFGNPPLALMAEDDITLMEEAFAPLANSESLSGRSFFVAGTGTGREVVALAKRDAQVKGIDIAPSYVGQTARKVAQLDNGAATRVLLQVAPLDDYTFGDEKYDGITSLFGVLNHVEQWDESIAKCSDALRPGGRLVVSMYGTNNATVYRLRANGEMQYRPSLVQSRVPGGIRLGEGEEVLPAVFPPSADICYAIEQAGMRVTRVKGFLDLAACFPKDPTPENLERYFELIAGIDPALVSSLRGDSDPDSILRSVYARDGALSENPDAIGQYAYVGFVAEKV